MSDLGFDGVKHCFELRVVNFVAPVSICFCEELAELLFRHKETHVLSEITELVEINSPTLILVEFREQHSRL